MNMLPLSWRSPAETVGSLLLEVFASFSPQSVKPFYDSVYMDGSQVDHKQYVEYISGSMLQHGHVETTRLMRMPQNEIKSKIVLGSKDCPQCGGVEDWNILNYKALCLWRFESVSSWPSQLTRIQSFRLRSVDGT